MSDMKFIEFTSGGVGGGRGMGVEGVGGGERQGPSLNIGECVGVGGYAGRGSP